MEVGFGNQSGDGDWVDGLRMFQVIEQVGECHHLIFSSNHSKVIWQQPGFRSQGHTHSRMEAHERKFILEDRGRIWYVD